MIRYTRVYAWLHTVPENQEESRYERYLAEGVTVVVPEMQCSYLFDYLQKIGIMTSNGMGNAPLSWQEINAWMQATGVPLNFWELGVIHKASAVYVHQLELSRKIDAPMPERVVEQDPRRLARHIKSILR